MSLSKEFIDWESEIKRLNHAKYNSNITIGDVKGSPKAVKSLVDNFMTVGSFNPKSTQC